MQLAFLEGVGCAPDQGESREGWVSAGAGGSEPQGGGGELSSGSAEDPGGGLAPVAATVRHLPCPVPPNPECPPWGLASPSPSCSLPWAFACPLEGWGRLQPPAPSPGLYPSYLNTGGSAGRLALLTGDREAAVPHGVPTAAAAAPAKDSCPSPRDTLAAPRAPHSARDPGEPSEHAPPHCPDGCGPR